MVAVLSSASGLLSKQDKTACPPFECGINSTSPPISIQQASLTSDVDIPLVQDFVPSQRDIGVERQSPWFWSNTLPQLHSSSKQKQLSKDGFNSVQYTPLVQLPTLGADGQEMCSEAPICCSPRLRGLAFEELCLDRFFGYEQRAALRWLVLLTDQLLLFLGLIHRQSCRFTSWFPPRTSTRDSYVRFLHFIPLEPFPGYKDQVCPSTLYYPIMHQLRQSPELLLRLKGKTAVITGSARGIGAATAALFNEHGSKVVITDLPSLGPQAMSLINSLRYPENAIFIPASVTEWKQMVEVFKAGKRTFGEVTIVVANAGIMESRPVLDVDLDELGDPVESTEASKVIDVNLKGALNSTLRIRDLVVSSRLATALTFPSYEIRNALYARQ